MTSAAVRGPCPTSEKTHALEEVTRALFPPAFVGSSGYGRSYPRRVPATFAHILLSSLVTRLVLVMLTKTRKETRRLPAHIVRAIAVTAQTDPRTVANVVAGRPTKASTRERILRALHERERGEIVAVRMERQR